MECELEKAYLEVGNHFGDIDLELYDLIKEIWEADYHTITACASDANDKMSITFICSHGAEFLLTCVQSDDDDGEVHSLGERSLSHEFDCEDNWEIGLGIMHPAAGSEFEGEIHLGIVVAFPKSDYDEVLLRVREFTL